MSETHTMILEETAEGRWCGWIDAFSDVRVEATRRSDVEEALRLLWAKLWTRKMFDSDPSEKTEPLAITLLGPAYES
jgi:hypothetical protein